MKICSRCNRNSDWPASFCPFCGSSNVVSVSSTVIKSDIKKTVSEQQPAENIVSFSKFHPDDSADNFESALQAEDKKPDSSDLSFDASYSNSLNGAVFTGHAANSDDASVNMPGSFSLGFDQSDNNDKKTEEA